MIIFLFTSLIFFSDTSAPLKTVDTQEDASSAGGDATGGKLNGDESAATEEAADVPPPEQTAGDTVQ